MSIMNMCKHFILISVLFHIRCSSTIKPGDFDYYKLVLQWPGTVCNATAVNCPDQWTIHGLWPASKSTKDPIKCSEVGYNEQEVVTIMDDMKMYWPNLQKNINTILWKHEWESHGTCSALTIKDYFETTINLAKKHDIKSYLQKKNIVPGKTYKPDDISKAILDSVKFSPALRRNCKQKEKLQEIFICYTKGLALMDCKQADSNVEKDVLYPPIPNQQLAAAFHQGNEHTCDDASSDSNRCVHSRVEYPIVLALVVYCLNKNWK
ncbi:ribonuclease Phyb-like [Crassostrea virginica]